MPRRAHDGPDCIYCGAAISYVLVSRDGDRRWWHDDTRSEVCADGKDEARPRVIA